MEKSRLNNFISKYHLNGLIQSVAWNANGSLSTRFISDDKSVVGEVKMNTFGGKASKFGVYNTDLLVKLMSVLGTDINFNVNSTQDKAYSLTIDDNSTTINYMLADMAVIPPTPELKQLPEFQMSIKITKEFIDKFIKAKSALSEVEHFTVAKNQKLDKYQIVIGHSSTNSNKISLDIECDVKEDIDPISFSAKYFREILAANKDLNGATMYVSSDGLAKVDFEVDGFETRYFLVKLENN